jgi:predicted P-loop ATPase
MDKARMSYDRHASTRARQFIIIANANESEFLVSQYGNRRFLPLHIHTRIDVEGLKGSMLQLYAEAVVAMKQHVDAHGSKLTLGEEHWAALADEQEERRVKSPIEDRVYKALGAFDQGHISCLDMYAATEVRMHDPKGVADVTTAMALAGWAKLRARNGGEKIRYYVKNDPMFTNAIVYKEMTDHNNNVQGIGLEVAKKQHGGPASRVGPSSL